jgi:hypothetical protein
MLCRHTTPVRIVIVDSAAPHRPQPLSGEEWITLDRNYQGIGDGTLNGWARGFALGAWYAWCCSADFIYVEQDCLVSGAGWVEAIYAHSIKRGHTRFLVGDTRQRIQRRKYHVPWQLQQCLVFVPRELIPRLLGTWCDYPADGEEERMADCGVSWDCLPFGCGRLRPVNWRARHLYLQHLKPREIIRMANREGMAREARRIMR